MLTVRKHAVRARLVEYGAPAPLPQGLVSQLRVDRITLHHQMVTAGDRIARTLHLRENPIAVESRGFRVSDVAGLLRVTPQLELEIAPKFLGAEWERWREDFFFISMLSRHGRLLANDRISSAVGTRGDLATLVARAVISMFCENQRRPLRTYRHSVVSDFAIEGDVEAESVVLPTVEGYEQLVVRYDRRNVFNAAILDAAKALLIEVSEPQTRRQLVRLVEVLAPQESLRRIQHRRLPNRSQRWQPLHELAIDVLNGFGVAYSIGAVRAPGFVVDTWRAWEDVLAIVLRSSWGTGNIAVQRSAPLGVRTLVDENRRASSRTAWVTPDFTVAGRGGVLLDAKYKGRVGDTRSRISEADLYEALAFSMAAKCGHVVLLYPAIARANAQPLPGACTVFESVSVGESRVVGMEIEVRGISDVGGFLAFSKGVRDGLERLLAGALTSVA